MTDDETRANTGDAASKDESKRKPVSAAVLLSALGIGFIVLRMFAVSGYDWETAFLVSTTLSLDDGLALVFGSLMSGYLLTAFLLMLVLPMIFAAYLWGQRRHRPVVMLLLVLGLVALFALAFSFGFWWLPVASAGVFGVYALIRILPSPNSVRRVFMAVLANMRWVVGIAVLLLAALVGTPWVPHEVIETKTGTVNGYVLSVDSGFLNVLTDEHEFLIVLSSTVLSRT